MQSTNLARPSLGRESAIMVPMLPAHGTASGLAVVVHRPAWRNSSVAAAEHEYPGHTEAAAQRRRPAEVSQVRVHPQAVCLEVVRWIDVPGGKADVA
jgi:hypothetical protein